MRIDNFTSDFTIDTKIDDTRFKPKKYLGRGTWGKVHLATDTLTGGEVAIKEYDPTDAALEQAKKRNVDEKSFMLSETLDPNTYRNIAPRALYSDKNNKPFIVTKKYDKFLSDILFDDTIRASYKNGNLSLNRILKIGTDLAAAIADLHTKRKTPKIHGDIQKDNIGLDYSNGVETAELSDFGSATTVALGLGSVKPGRENSGFLLTREPNMFYWAEPGEKKDLMKLITTAVPETESDVWSVAALITRMYTGKYPLEDLISTSEIPEKAINELNHKEYNKIIKTTTKEMPYKLRKTIRKALSKYRHERQHNGEELYNELKVISEHYSTKFHALKDFWKWTKRLAIPLAVVSMLTYGVATNKQPEKEYVTNVSQGEIMNTTSLPIKTVQFVKEPETIYKPDPEVMISSDAFNDWSDNAYAVFLIRKYRVALDHSEPRFQDITNYQKNIGLRTMTEDEIKSTSLEPVIRSIELALDNNYKNGTIDLEDVCTESVLGPKVLADAKRISGSEDFSKYKWARYKNGTYVIPSQRRNLLETWMRNIEIKSYQFGQSEADSTQGL